MALPYIGPAKPVYSMLDTVGLRVVLDHGEVVVQLGVSEDE